MIKDRQHGFRPQKDTKKAIAVTYETIANALANKQQVYLVLLRDVARRLTKYAQRPKPQTDPSQRSNYYGKI